MNGFGATTVLAITTAYRVDSITILPIINLGAAVSSMTARAKGAGDTRRIKNCTAIGIAMVAGVSAALAAGVFFFGIKFVEIFGVTGEALEIGGQFFRDLSSFYVIFGVAVVLRSVLEGIGQATIVIDDINGLVIPGLTDNLAIKGKEVIPYTINRFAVTDAGHIVGIADVLTTDSRNKLTSLRPTEVPFGSIVVINRVST